jgi:hypothetical protein
MIFLILGALSIIGVVAWIFTWVFLSDPSLHELENDEFDGEPK